MTPDSPIDEELIIEERVLAEPTSPAERPGWPLGRIVGIVGLALAGLALGLTATAVALRLTTRPGGRRRSALLNFQPRVAVFAPSLTVAPNIVPHLTTALPGSTIAGRTPLGRTARIPTIPLLRRRRAVGRRGTVRQVTGRRRWTRAAARRLPAR